MATSRRSRTSARARLRTYRDKRDFSLTSEPSPEVPAPRAGVGPVFVVHKHDATRLHYDLRLEIDGVLVSWAIPKGPSYDPADKRLAVQTEDHPLAYATFEGRIPEGAYGAGDSILWDSGTFDTVPPGQASEQLQRGRLHVVLRGEKLEGEWHLIRTRPRGGKAQWLCFKAKDGTERPDYDVAQERPASVKSGQPVTRGPRRARRAEPPARAPRPSRRKSNDRTPDALLKKWGSPMLATLAQVDATAGADWRFEVKYDGFRALAAVQGDRVSLQSRGGKDLSSRFPAIARALETLGEHSLVVDGELVALDAQGRSRFQLLGKGAEERFVIFDLLWLDGEDLRPLPLEERRKRLERLLARVKPPLALAERVEGSAKQALAMARRRELEGVMAKRVGSPYTSGRGADWLKLKVQANQEVAIVGFTPMANERPEIGALLVAVREGDTWHYAGKVGTGYSAKVRRELRTLLSRDVVKKPPVEDAPLVLDALRSEEAFWVKPRHVAQVAFTEWTDDGRLRHPSFQGLRGDKRPEECIRERPRRAPVASERPSRSVRGASAGTSASSRGPHRRAGTKVRQGARAAGRTSVVRKNAPAVPATRPVVLTHGERVLFPEAGFTKADVFAYYRDVAPVMVPALEGRPLALQQWPQGVDAPGFFRQGVQSAPDWLTTVRIRHETRTLSHVVVDTPESLLWLANQSALTLHIWSSRVRHLKEPDWVLFDLDPGPGGTFDDLIQLATSLRSYLERRELRSVPKTSGKRGLHVLVPLSPSHTYEQARTFAQETFEVLARRHPELATTERSKERRQGRLYLDADQNAWGKTLVAPYSLRALPHAPVSTPLAWSEVTPRLDPRRFTLDTLRRRLDQVGDLFAPALTGGQRLPGP
ncbi:DNA ligase D [Vitiosangium sp. GDMCC 1.1324]|uniref:DNA ligase D n=1 Tax=Vitiosangium sp. (strain GDMCC 1.1324) TaxID=2138576 RepID=UPI000D3CE1A1|nr:DNA ligase D [Vitiosangium sp. GDMCC 1.1324]PTL83613.1 DNA ligase D [Vitiosangium sp. GDMCC 1.1324]